MASRPLLTYQDAARRLQTSKRSVQRLVQSGQLPVVKIGRLARIDSRDLDDFLEIAKNAW